MPEMRHIDKIISEINNIRGVMSRVIVKAIMPGKKTEDIVDLKNSHGFGPFVWTAICGRYLGNDMAWIGPQVEYLWPLWKRQSISIHQRAVLAMTYDMAYIKKDDFARAAKDIQLFIKDFSAIENRVNHLPKIAEIFESGIDVPAIGFSGSLSEDLWEGDFDEETEEYGPPDMSKALDVYFEIDSQK